MVFIRTTYFDELWPGSVDRTLTKGEHTFSIPSPMAGTWSFSVVNDPAYVEKDLRLVSTDKASYTASVVPLDGLLETSVEKQLRRRFFCDSSIGVRRFGEQIYSLPRVTRHESFRASGEPNLTEMEVPSNAGSLIVRAQSNEQASKLELYVYDCTTGECFLSDCTIPAAHDQKVVIRRPAQGRWVVAVNAAPAPMAQGSFTLERV
jgi:hypothetical protein